MNTLDVLKQFASDNGSGIVNGIINFAADLSLMFADLLFWFQLTGIVLFIWGVWGFANLKKPNSQVTPLAVGMKMIFGAVLYQLTLFFTDASQSLWVDASPATPMGYVAAAQSAQQSNPIAGMLLAVLAILTFVGWIFAGKGIFGLATLASKQDRQGEFWKNIWTCVGAVILLNLILFVTDVAESFAGVSGSATISASGFN